MASELELTLKNIGELDTGAIGMQFDQCLRDSIRDTIDRGHDKKKRVVTLEVEVCLGKSSTKDQFDSAPRLIVTPKIKMKLPPYCVNDTVAKAVMDKGEIKTMFQKWSPENPDQQELPLDKEGSDRDA